MYRDDINVTFAPENSNNRDAVGWTKLLVTQLKKKGPQALKDFQEQIDKKIELGTLVKMSYVEHEEVKKGPHHYCYPATSNSTNFRLLNASNTNVPGSVTSLSIQNVCPANPIGYSFNVQQKFMLKKHAYSSNISKAYLRVLVDTASRKMWFKDPLTMQKPIFFRQQS